MNNQNIVTIPNLSKQYFLASPALFGIAIASQTALGCHGRRHWVWHRRRHWVVMAGDVALSWRATLRCHGGRGKQILVRQVGNCKKTLIIHPSSPASPLQNHEQTSNNPYHPVKSGQSTNPPIHQSTNPPIHQSTNPPIPMNQTPYNYDPLTLPHAPKRDKPLSLWNPLDYLLLLYWVFYFPQAVRWYVEKFGSLPYDIDGRKAIRQDPIQRKLALQGLLLSIIFPLTLFGLLRWSGIIGLSGISVVFGIIGALIGGLIVGVIEGIGLGVKYGIIASMVGGIAGGIAGDIVDIMVAGLTVAITATVGGGIGASSLFNPLDNFRKNINVFTATTISSVIGIVGGIVGGIVLNSLIGVVIGVIAGATFGIVFGIAGYLRLDALLIFYLLRLSFLEDYLQSIWARSSPLPSPTLQQRLILHLKEDWLKGVMESEGLRQYSRQFSSILFAIQQILLEMPSDLLLLRITAWCSLPLYDWEIVRFQSTSLKNRFQKNFWNGLWIIPSRWRPQVKEELRFDTSPRAACAAFWLLHEERLAEAADAFEVVRELRHGEELYGNARAMAEAVRCWGLGAMASWEVPPEPPDEVLRPHVREGLLIFGRVAEDAAIVLKSRSARQRNAALNRASGALVGFLKGLERYPTPERDNLARIAEQWLKIVLSHASEVGTLEVREPVSSPYIVGAIVPPERLVGREDIFAQLSGMWSKEGQRDSLVVYGHRRMGKSSIVRNVTHFCKLGADTGLAVLNLQSVDWAEELRDLSYAIAFELWQALPTTVAEPEPDDFESRPLPTLRRLLAHLHQAHPQRRYILILDEYELLDQKLPQEVASSFVTLLRGLTQQHPWLVMALVGLYTLEERSASYYQAIYAWRPIRVGLMDADAVADTLQLQTDDFPLEYSLAAVALAHQLSGGQPFLVQLIGDSLVQRFNRQLQQQLEPPSPVFEASDIHAVVNDPHFYQQGDAYFNGIWKQAAQNPSAQHTILQTLAPHKEGLPQNTLQQATRLDNATFSAALNALMRHDVILCQNDNCRYTVELMRRWVEGGEG